MSQMDLFREPESSISDWRELSWFQTDFEAMEARIDQYLEEGNEFCPSRENIYNAFELTPFDKVRVVIIGQDPYPTPTHAHGLAFSVPPNIRRYPPSLGNIFRELHEDLGCERKDGNLESWAKQGVLLLNTTLTVERGRPGSHVNWGWQKLTTQAVKALVTQRTELVFCLWGTHAIQMVQAVQKEAPHIITRQSHHVFRSSHPSPLSAANGFFGSRPFSGINKVLVQMGLNAIDWCK